MREIYVETGVGMATDAGAAAWSFDLDLWGVCAQGPTAADAVSAFEREHGPARVVETIHGDEQAFARDRLPATDVELDRTLGVLAAVRPRTLALLDLPGELLDRDDPTRVLPTWARWRTVRLTLWHIADTESRYYLPALGVAPRERLDDLAAELRASAAHVAAALTRLPRDRYVHQDGEVWTTVKVLRRLAWHERGEVAALAELVAGWDASVGTAPPSARQRGRPD